MYWNCAKVLLASTATAVVTSQVVKRVYRYFVRGKSLQTETKSNCICNESSKNREINDVILFTDNSNRHTTRHSQDKEITSCEDREISCYKLIKYLKSARETLDVCMFLITSKEIAENIIRLGQSHVLVRIIVDDNMAHVPQSQIQRFKEYSHIQIQPKQDDVIMHHKFCIIDGPKAIKRKYLLKENAEKLNVHAQSTKRSSKSYQKTKSSKGFVMSGSLNWSTQAMISNRENVIVTSHSSIVNKLEKEFNNLWVESEPVLIKNNDKQ